MLSQIHILLFLHFTVLVFGQNLSCFECVPSSTQKCESPNENLDATPCNLDTNSTDGMMMMTKEIYDMMNSNSSSQEPPFCYALYLNAGENSNQTGYYRGCSKKNPSAVKFCEMLSAKMNSSGGLRNCETCTSDKCNFKNFVNMEGKRLAAASDISCYDCDPQNENEKCLAPKDNNVKITNCQQDYEQKNGNSASALEFECFTFYLNETSDGRLETGIYRGCIDKNSTTESTCDFLRRKYPGSTIAECDSCSSTGCNEQTPKSYPDDDNNSSVTTTFSIFCIFSFFLMFYLL